MHRKIMFITVICTAAMLCFAVPQKNITEKTYGSIIVNKFLSVNDNLIIRCDINQWPAIIGKDISVRINGILPMAAGSKDEIEKIQAQAEKFTADRLTAARLIILSNIKRGGDFSIVADVMVDGVDLADMLAEKNLALRVIYNATENKLSGPAEEIVIDEIVMEASSGYLASKNSKVFHHHTCSQTGRIAEKNITRFESKDAAVQTGRRPCKICKP
jgi:micrococcal nuclease